MAYYNSSLGDKELSMIKREVIIINNDLNSPGHLKDEVFELLKKVGTLIFYPLEEENLKGIYIEHSSKNYFIINNHITLEEKVFTAAHELAHSIDMAKLQFEVVTSNKINEYVNHGTNSEENEIVDQKANRFAAELLVGEKQLKKYFEELPESLDLIVKSVILSGTFLVPYKTIVKRLFEIGIIKSYEELSTLLKVDKETTMSIATRYEVCNRNFEYNDKIVLGGYINKALTRYENDLSTYSDLSKLLKLIKKTPEEFGIEEEVDTIGLINHSIDNDIDIYSYDEDDDDE